MRLSDLTRDLAALHLKAVVVVLDAARANPFSLPGQPLATGLGWVAPEPGMLIAFNATPGTVAPEGQIGYGPYAKAIAEMICEGGLSAAEVFDSVRLRVNEMTKGTQVPWDVSNIETKVIFFEQGPGAPRPRVSLEQADAMRVRPMSELRAEDAYMVALLRDTFDGYGDFLAMYPHDPMANQVRAILAARREAITWRRTYQDGTPEAFWSYLKRYPRGSHTADARRLLAHLGAGLEPPSRFRAIEYDMPSPMPSEMEYVERPVLVFDDPVFKIAPPPPVKFLEPPPAEFAALEPPAPPKGAIILPAPVFVPIPVYINVPEYVVAPTNSVNNIHNAASDNSASNGASDPQGQIVLTPPILPLGVPGGASIPLFSALPVASIEPKTAPIDSQSQAPFAASPATTAPSTSPLGQALPTSLIFPPLTGNPPVATPLTATLSPPASGNVPLPIPRPAALSSPATVVLAPPILPLGVPGGSLTLFSAFPVPSIEPRTAPIDSQSQAPFVASPATTALSTSPLGQALPTSLLSPPLTGNPPVATPFTATLSPPASGNVPLPIPRPAALSSPATTNKSKSKSNPLSPPLSQQASPEHATPLAGAAIRAAPVVRQVQAPPPSPRAAVRPDLPPGPLPAR